MMAKFNIGDRVRVISDGCGYIGDFSIGDIGYIKADDGSNFRNLNVWLEDKSNWFWLDDSEVEIVTPSPAAIVALIDGTPKPSERPRIHGSEVTATAEADRLARKYPGETFGVFVQTAARVADVTVRAV